MSLYKSQDILLLNYSVPVTMYENMAFYRFQIMLDNIKAEIKEREKQEEANRNRDKAEQQKYTRQQKSPTMPKYTTPKSNNKFRH